MRTRIVAELGVIAMTLAACGTPAPERDSRADFALQCVVKPDRNLGLEMLDHTETLPAGFPLWVLHDDAGAPYRAVMVGGAESGELRTVEDLDCRPAAEIKLERRIVTLCNPLPGSTPESFAMTSIERGKSVELAYRWMSNGDTGEPVIHVYSSGQRDVYVKEVDEHASPGSLWAEPMSDYAMVTSPEAIDRATRRGPGCGHK